MKKTGMARHPPIAGVVVMDFAAENPFPPRAVLRGRNHIFDRLKPPGSELGQIDEGGGAQTEGLKDSVLAEALERRAAHHLHAFT
jgi:hypothetical protein